MDKQPLLDRLDLPTELKNLTRQEFEQLAQEVRERLLDIGDQCGGHLASNLGIVELTIALHAIFESPKDKFIFDVSHQAYVHKMFTGRLNDMYSIRQDNGLSGFAKISESEHDIFGAGHASTSLSAALGVAQARDILNEDYHVVAVAGDAAFSGGMMFEAMNNIEKLKKGANFICILNDNDMSISPPVGNMSSYINNIRTSKLYNNARKKIARIFNTVPMVGRPMLEYVDKSLRRIRDTMMDVKMGVIFEEFGFKYIGPIDGHSIPQLMAAIRFAKRYEGPVMIHVITTKGKGHEPAESDPVKYHGVSPKKKAPAPSTVTVTPTVAQPLPSYSKVFGTHVCDIAARHEDVAVITPAMQGGSGLDAFAAAYPERFIDVGIAEEHAVTFAAGLARAGVKPILAIYSTFLQRGYDQLIHDVCLQKLPVIFCLDRSGLVGQDGPTHHGVFDYGFMLPIPNLHILAPKDGAELEAMMDWSVTQDTAVSIRYGRGSIPQENGAIQSPVNLGKAELLYQSKADTLNILLIGVGSMAWPCHRAAAALDQDGIAATAVNLRFVKPLDKNLLAPLIAKADHILVVEEGQEIGGVNAYLKQVFASDKPLNRWHSLAIPDEFVDHGMPATLAKAYGFTDDGIVDMAKQHCLQQVLLT